MKVAFALLSVGINGIGVTIVSLFFSPQLNGLLMASSDPFYVDSSDLFLPFYTSA